MPKTTSAFTIGPDVDLDADDVRTSTGRRLTTDVAAEITQDVLEQTGRRGRGRPTLSGTKEPAVGLSLRVPLSMKQKLAQRAERDGKRESDIAREALAAYLR